MFTVTGTSTAGLNWTVLVKATADPRGRTGLDWLLTTEIEGLGTN